MNKTAKEFWNAYDHFLEQNIPMAAISNDLERLRFRCLLGFVALDASLNYFWNQEVLPDWENFITLVRTTLQSDTEIHRLVKLTGENFRKSQWVSSLRFIENTGEPDRFSPSLADVGCALILLKPRYSQISIPLFELQKLRNKTLHTGKDFQKKDAHHCQSLLAEFRESMASLSPVFQSAHSFATHKKAA